MCLTTLPDVYLDMRRVNSFFNYALVLFVIIIILNIVNYQTLLWILSNWTN